MALPPGDLKLEPVLEATQPEQMQAVLEPFFGADAEPSKVELTRLQPPICCWLVYRSGDRRVTLKSFFSGAEYTRYAEKLAKYYPDRMGCPGHPLGGIVLHPELNAVLWSFPFDPAMPNLYRCVDSDWVGEAMRRRSPDPLQPRVIKYSPELRALVAYREPKRGRVVAYGKTATKDLSARIYVVMNRLWSSEARISGRLRMSRPIAFRPEAGFLLQAPVPGKPLHSDRNQKLFVDLARNAGSALAAIQAMDIPFGEKRGMDELLPRLDAGLQDLLHTSPPQYRTLRKLLGQIRLHASRTTVGPLIPSHGDFKWDQFLHSRGSFSLIDLELFCQSEPAFDAGYFCAYLAASRPKDWRESAAVEVHRGVFLRAYLEAVENPPPIERIAVCEAATLALRGLSHAWQFRKGWERRTAHMLELAFERLADPEPKPTDEWLTE